MCYTIYSCIILLNIGNTMSIGDNMIIKGFRKNNYRGRMNMVNKVGNKISLKEILINEIDNSSTNDWNELCSTCSSLIEKSGMTETDIDNIVMKVKKGTM